MAQTGLKREAAERRAKETAHLLEALKDGEAQALMRMAVERALAGDKGMLRFVLSRLLAPARHRPVSFELPDTSGLGPAEAAEAGYGALLKAVAAGEVAPAEAKGIADLIERTRRTAEEARSAVPGKAEPRKAAPKPAPAAAPVLPSVFSPDLAAARPAGLRAALLGGAASIPSPDMAGRVAAAAASV